MKKSLAILSILTAFVFSLGMMAWVYAADQKAADSFKIDNDKALFKDGKRTKPAVEYSHKKHEIDYKIACTECHHVYKDGKNTWKKTDKVQKCSECHKVADQGKTLSLQNSFHKNCKDCHTKLKTEGKKTGPTLCAQCHPVEKK